MASYASILIDLFSVYQRNLVVEDNPVYQNLLDLMITRDPFFKPVDNSSHEDMITPIKVQCIYSYPVIFTFIPLVYIHNLLVSQNPQEYIKQVQRVELLT